MAGAGVAPSRPVTRSLIEADASRLSRRAFGDVSNQATANTDKNTNRASKARHSRRLSGDEPSSNPAEEETTTTTTVAPRRSRRLSSGAVAANILQPKQQNLKAPPKRAPAKKPAATTSRPAKRSSSRRPARGRPAKRSTREVDKAEPPRKLRRRSSSGKAAPEDPSVCNNPCLDILTNTDHGLQRHPFDASKYTAGIAEYDKEKKDDPQEVSSYVTDIFQRHFESEANTKPHPYIEEQPALNSMMRSILVDWLVEVHTKFRLLPETLYLCINILDRYLSQTTVPRRKLQLVGVTSLLLACKYEEIYPPEVKDCVYITDRAYTRQDVLDMEAHIVKTLEFRMTVATGYPFLKRFLEIVNASKMTKNLANFYMERMLQEYGTLSYRPSVVAAAAVSLAMNNPDTLDFDGEGSHAQGVPPILLRYTGFSKCDIREVAVLMESKVPETETTKASRTLVSVKRKYESDRYDNVSAAFAPPKARYLDTP